MNPDELLKSIEKEEKKKTRGRLRIFLGMCPGVGKTYSMLEAAQEQVRSGSKVVVGIVETHSRKETEKLLSGLTIIPRKKIEYRSKAFEELDFESVIKKKPDLAVIDELAHTNIPGSLHPKRYQDVQEILEAGIDVYTTINIQHIESRVDLVKQITGVTVHETVPDSFFELADQVELIDLPPQELLKRLKEGKVYLGEMADRAKENFFKEEHLLALRELSLRFTAEVVDDELHDQMVKKQISGPWQTREKLLVAISHSPYSKRLIRAARRMAFNLEASWIALYVDSGEPLSDEDKDMLRKNVDMAIELGAELVTIRDSNIPGAIRQIAEEKNVTQIVMGRPDRRFLDILRGGTLLDQLVKETSDIDVHVLRQQRRPRFRGFRFKMPKFGGGPVQYSNTFWLFVAITGIGAALEPYIGYQAVGYLYLAGVLLVASLADRGPILFGAILSTFVWNYGFIPPRFTFYIRETTDVMMSIAYFAIAVVGSTLTSIIRKQQRELRTRSQQTNLLYDFARTVAAAIDIEGIKRITAKFIEGTLEGRCTLLLRERTGALEGAQHTSSGFPLGQKSLAVAQWVNDNGKKAGLGTSTLSGTDVFSLPLRGTETTVGVVMFFPENGKAPSLEQEAILEAVTAASAIAIERQVLQESAQKIKVFEESEKLYEAILDSVSHELRTPITAIVGAASALSDKTTGSSEVNRKSLTEDLVKSAERLNHVVENLLDMSRLSSGKLELKKEIVEVSDLVEETVRDFRAASHVSQSLIIDCEPGLYTSVDTKMMEHVLFNLLRNASQYSPQKAQIQIIASQSKGNSFLVLDVLDEGKGIPKDAQEKVFQKFYREDGSPSGGVGLGLSIVKGIVEAHGGKVSVSSREDRSGSRFRVMLPMWKEKVPV